MMTIRIVIKQKNDQKPNDINNSLKVDLSDSIYSSALKAKKYFRLKKKADFTKNKVWIMIREDMDPWSYTTQRMINAFKNAGVKDVNVVKGKSVTIILDKNIRNSLMVDGERCELPDIVIGRTGSNCDQYTLALYKHLEGLGVHVFNTSEAMELAGNKLFTYQILAMHNVPIPKTILLNNIEYPVDIQNITNQLNFPMVVKYVKGSGGLQVFLAHNLGELKLLCRILENVKSKEMIVFQEYIESSKGRDLRVVVVGDKAVVGVLRANESNFRSNVHSGGKDSWYPLDDKAKEIAVKSAQVLGLEFAGVDLLFDVDPNTGEVSYKVCEVNSCSGFSPKIEQHSKVNVSEHVINYLRDNM